MEVIMEGGVTEGELEMLKTAMGHAFQKFSEDCREASNARVLYHHCEAPRIFDASNMLVDATFTLEIERVEQWHPIERMVGPEGAGRPYMAVLQIIHYYPFTTVYDVTGQRISVSPISGGVWASGSQAGPVHLSVAFTIRCNRSSVPRKLLGLPSRPRKWV